MKKIFVFVLFTFAMLFLVGCNVSDLVDKYGDKDERKLKRNMPEAPKIYKSRVNPGVIVYEYKNRYDLYEEHNDQLVLVSTEYKKGKHGRKSRE